MRKFLREIEATLRGIPADLVRPGDQIQYSAYPELNTAVVPSGKIRKVTYHINSVYGQPLTQDEVIRMKLNSIARERAAQGKVFDATGYVLLETKDRPHDKVELVFQPVREAVQAVKPLPVYIGRHEKAMKQADRDAVRDVLDDLRKYGITEFFIGGEFLRGQGEYASLHLVNVFENPEQRRDEFQFLEVLNKRFRRALGDSGQIVLGDSYFDIVELTNGTLSQIHSDYVFSRGRKTGIIDGLVSRIIGQPSPIRLTLTSRTRFNKDFLPA